MEAGWIAALVVTPLFFNTYSSRTFEPDKIALLRTIALVVAAAWGAKLLEEGRWRLTLASAGPDRVAALRQAPLLLPVTFLLASYLLSTLFSVVPHISYWGSFSRLQGLYTTLAYIVIFAAIATHMRRRDQVDRLINTVALTALPVSLYGVMQRLQLDPLPWGEDTTQRVTSTLGNAIFIAAYLIMAMPLTALRAAEYFRRVMRQEERLALNVARASVFAASLAAQALALWFSGSRGPWLGFLAGGFSWSLLLPLALKQRRVMFAMLVLAALTGLFLVALNVPNGPLESLRRSGPLSRLGHVFEVEDGTSKVRLLIWQGAAQIALPHQPLTYPDGKLDALNILRPLIGYGPESMYVAFNRFYSPEIAHYEKRNASPDRSHNETWDALITTGALGLAAYLFLFAAAIFFGLQWLGLLSPADKKLYAAFLVAGAIAGAAGLGAFGGIAYLGVGLPFGMLMGLLACITYLAITRSLPPVDQWQAAVLAALLAGIVAHFTEIHFGIAIAASRLHFWAYLGVMLAVGWAMPRHTDSAVVPPMPAQPVAASRAKSRRPARPDPKLQTSAGRRWLSPSNVVLAVVVVTLGFNFVINAARAQSTLAILWRALASVSQVNGAANFSILLLIVWTVAAGVVIFSASRREIIISALVAIGVALFYGLFQASTLASLSSQQPATVDELINLVAAYDGMYTTFNAIILALMAAMAWALTAESTASSPTRTLASWASALPLALAVAAGYITNVLVVQADMSHKAARPFESAGQLDVVIPIYQRAVSLAPLEDQYYLFLGRAYLQLAQGVSKPAQQEAILNIAMNQLVTAQSLNPLNPDHAANIARLQRHWSLIAATPQQAQEHWQTANEFYAVALTLSPNSPPLWNEWARLSLAAGEDPALAYDRLAISATLDPLYAVTFILLGDYWMERADLLEDDARVQAYRQAIYNYERAIFTEQYGADYQSQLLARLGSAVAYRKLERWDEATAIYLDVLALATPDSNLWAVHNALAEVYQLRGDTPSALASAQQALALAPESNKPAIVAFIDTIDK